MRLGPSGLGFKHFGDRPKSIPSSRYGDRSQECGSSRGAGSTPVSSDAQVGKKNECFLAN